MKIGKGTDINNCHRLSTEEKPYNQILNKILRTFILHGFGVV